VDDAREWARDREGYYEYLALLADATPSVARRGARWVIDAAAADMIHESVVAKDCYETPAWIVEHYVAREIGRAHV
jgi:hypothetical protein